MPIIAAMPEATAAEPSPAVRVSIGKGNGNSFSYQGIGFKAVRAIAVEHADGSVTVYAISGTTSQSSEIGVAWQGADDSSYQAQLISPQSDGSYLNDLPGETNVVFGVTDLNSGYGGDPFLPKIKPLYDVQVFDGLIVGLTTKPAQPQAATVAAVPTTGAPKSDLILPAALLATGMVGGGFLIRKKKDRNRA